MALPRETCDFYGYSNQSDIVVDLDTGETVRGRRPPIGWLFALQLAWWTPWLALELWRSWRSKGQWVGQCEVMHKNRLDAKGDAT